MSNKTQQTSKDELTRATIEYSHYVRKGLRYLGPLAKGMDVSTGFGSGSFDLITRRSNAKHINEVVGHGELIVIEDIDVATYGNL